MVFEDLFFGFDLILLYKKCVKILHPSEAISQIGLIQQQIKFTTNLKLKNDWIIEPLMKQKSIANFIGDLVQKYLKSFDPRL